MKIPFVDLKAQFESLKDELAKALETAVSSFSFIGGNDVSRFEEEFANALGLRHCISVGSGTDALFIALRCSGVQSGNEVIVPAFTWISSSEAISLCGAKPVFADVDPQTYTISAAEIEKRITARTRAVLIVHLYGHCADMSAIENVCHKHKLLLLEDCAQAHLTTCNGKYAGTFGEAAAFSFYPTKNLGAYGDAGCIVTDNGDLADRMRRFANHGQLQRGDHLIEGINSRLDTLQAAVLRVKLPHLERWNSARAQHAKLYASLLAGLPTVQTPAVRRGCAHTYHIYAIRASRRDELRQYLRENGIETIIHYPSALPFLPAYQHLRHTARDFPVSYQLQAEMLSLPVYPELTDMQISYVCEKIRTFYQK